MDFSTIIGLIIVFIIFSVPIGFIIFSKYRQKIRIKKEYFDKEVGKIIFAQRYSVKITKADFSGEFLTIFYPKSGSLRQAGEYFKENREGIAA